MSIQLCDYSAYAVVLVPNVHGAIHASLYHWRHFDGARDPTDVQLLHDHHIPPYATLPEPGIPSGRSWASTHLAPALQAISPMVPKNIKVAVCLWENTPIQNGFLRRDIGDWCEGYATDPRDVTFELVELAGPFASFLAGPASSDAYVAIYTVKPENVVRIYQRSGIAADLVHEEYLDDDIDITEPEADLEHSVVSWVTDSLRPALDLKTSSDVKIQLYLPTEDLRANRNNDYNSVREQIMRQLSVTPIERTSIVLAGSSDAETPNITLDSLFEVAEVKFRTCVKYLVTVQYGSDSMDIVVERWNGSIGVELFNENIYHETDSIVEQDISAALGRAITSRNDDGGKNNTPLLLLLSADDETDDKGKPKSLKVLAMHGEIINVLAAPVKYKVCGSGQIQYQVLQWTAVRTGGAGGYKGRASFVFNVLPRHVVIVDAGSTGTRAVVYRWVTSDSGPPTIFNRRGEAPFQHPWLPYIKYVGEVDVNGGIHLVPAATLDVAQLQVQAYLEPLRVRLNALLVRALAIKGTTQMFMLATGGMRSIDAGVRERLETAIQQSGFFNNEFENHQYALATGPQEAIYGWITANYALGRLERPLLNRYGFLEMGGQSVQIAYETTEVVEAAANVARMDLTINWQAKERVFKVFTKMIGGLGAQAARTTYLTQLVGDQDRCSFRGQDVPAPNGAKLGTGLGGAEITLVETPLQQRHLRLTESVLPVFRLLGCNNCNPAARCGNCPANLLAGGPAVNFAARNMRFVGGSSFWYSTNAIYQGRIRQEHSFRIADIRRMIIEFALRDWPNHQAEIAGEVNAKILAMTPAVVHAKVPGGAQLAAKRVALTETLIAGEEFHRRKALFAAILMYTTLYDGVRLPPGTTAPVLANGVPGGGGFHPFNGVVGLHADSISKGVPYSWTLGRALIHAVGGNVVPA